MEIMQKFALNAPPQSVWAFLTDPYQVVSCLPGARITEKIDDRMYTGTVTVKIGPVTANYKGKICFERLDPQKHEAEIVGRADETKGRGGAEMRMVSCLSPVEGGGSEVSILSEVNLIGILAQFGRGMIQDVSEQIFQQFASCMKSKLEAAAPGGRLPIPPATDKLDIFSLASKVLGRQLKRIAGRLGLSKS